MQRSRQEVERRIKAVLKADTTNFVELVKIAGYDPAADFRNRDLRGIDFTGCDLAGFDFRGSKLANANFENAQISKAKFDIKQLRLKSLAKAIDFQKIDESSLHFQSSVMQETAAFKDVLSISRPRSKAARQLYSLLVNYLPKSKKKLENVLQDIKEDLPSKNNRYTYATIHQMRQGKGDTELIVSVANWLKRQDAELKVTVAEIIIQENIAKNLLRVEAVFVENCAKGNIKKVRDAILIDAYIDTTNEEGETGLMAACAAGHVSIVELLLENVADVSLHRISDGSTALILASRKGNNEVVELLIHAGADVNQPKVKGRSTALIAASYYGHIDTVEKLVAAGANINQQRKSDGFSPIMAACNNRYSDGTHLDIISHLVNSGSQIDAKTTRKSRWYQSGTTALMLAALKGNKDIVSLLLELGANVNAETDAGKTPLMHASQNKNYDICEMLVEHGAKGEFIPF